MASKLIPILVFLFDLAAFSLAVAAELRRSTGKVVLDKDLNYIYCVYDSKIATWFGAGALLFLLAGQILAAAASKCFCCGPCRRTAGPLILFLFSWLTSLISVAFLLIGSIMNACHKRNTKLFFEDAPSCHTVRKGVFATGAAFVFVTAIFSESYYISDGSPKTPTLHTDMGDGLLLGNTATKNASIVSFSFATWRINNDRVFRGIPCDSDRLRESCRFHLREWVGLLGEKDRAAVTTPMFGIL